jgi:hypothetical protein
MNVRHFSAVLVFGLAFSGPAEANVITFTGQDDGAAIGSTYTNSNAAQASLIAAASAFGPVDTLGFAGYTVGTFSGTWPNGVGTWTTTQPVGCCTNGISGISNITDGNLYGFNVSTANGTGNWLGFPGGTATFDNTSPTNSFGFFATGVQTIFGTTFTVSFNDGSPETLNVPVNVNGGVEYFGFTDTSSFTSVTISRPAGVNGTDAWGIDEVSFNASGVPGPVAGAGLPGLVFAAGGVLAYWRRRHRAA